MSRIWQLSQQYSSDYNGYVVPACMASGYLLDPDADVNDPANFHSNLVPAHSQAYPGSQISFDDQLLVYLGVPLDQDFSPSAFAAAKSFQCPCGPWGFVQNGWQSLGDYNPCANWCPTDPAGDDTHTWSGNYALNIHVNNSPGTNQFRSWDGASWVLAQADPRAPLGPSIYGWRTPLDGVGLKTAQWEDPGGTIFLFESWRNCGWSCRGDRGQLLVDRRPAGGLLQFRRRTVLRPAEPGNHDLAGEASGQGEPHLL